MLYMLYTNFSLSVYIGAIQVKFKEVQLEKISSNIVPENHKVPHNYIYLKYNTFSSRLTVVKESTI